MILKRKDYRSCKEKIVKVYRDKGIKKAKETIILFNIPLVAGYTFIMEEYPDAKLEDEIKSLTKFYKYVRIEG